MPTGTRVRRTGDAAAVEGAAALLPPPRDLYRRPLVTVPLDPSGLWRVSRFAHGEPHFGRTAANRFDDPHRTAKRRFGTCYLGCSLEVALAETLLHDELPQRGQFRVAASEVADRCCWRFQGPVLQLADLTGVAAKALVGSGEISTVMPYALPQRWSRALQAHPAGVDGLLYMSRHVNDTRAVVLFDRAGHKLQPGRCSRLVDTPEALHALVNLRVSIQFV